MGAQLNAGLAITKGFGAGGTTHALGPLGAVDRELRVDSCRSAGFEQPGVLNAVDLAEIGARLGITTSAGGGLVEVEVGVAGGENLCTRGGVTQADASGFSDLNAAGGITAAADSCLAKRCAAGVVEQQGSGNAIEITAA